MLFITGNNERVIPITMAEAAGSPQLKKAVAVDHSKKTNNASAATTAKVETASVKSNE